MMTIDGLIAVVSLVLTAFGLGYTIGSNNNRVGEKPFPYSRAGHPSATADMFPLDARVHKNNRPSLVNLAVIFG